MTITNANYKTISEEDIVHFQSILGQEQVYTDIDNRKKYSCDYTENLSFLPEIVLKPTNTEQVSKILSYCNEIRIPVTPSGARTGLSGGALPVFGGVNLSLERMNKVLAIDEKNFQVRVQTGIINQVMQEQLAALGLFYPPDPSSWGSCTIGGNLAHNAGGPKAVKYGVTKDYVLNLEVVLANGQVIQTGADVLKNATGYNLTQLFVGSEGTLGVITAANLKLIPAVNFNLLLLVPFRNQIEACEAVPQLFMKGIIPSGLEFMERDAILYTIPFVSDFNISIPDDIQAHLLIELDGNDMDVLMAEAEKVMEVLSNFDIDDVLFADNEAQKQMLWKLRRKVGEAVKSHSIYKEEDTVVPRYQMATLLQAVKSIGKKYGFKSVCYGHVGDGNLHVNILKGDLSDEVWQYEIKNGIREIFEVCKSLGGTISGEHGIGFVQKEYMDVMFTPHHLQLFKGIKDVFDPNGILNPGKIWM